MTEDFDEQFDLDGNSIIDTNDLRVWLTNVGNENLGRPFLMGDSNLDATVDAADLNVVGQNWLSDVTGWSQGDFNGDGRMDALDLNEVGKNWLKTAVADTSPVPEPLGLVLGLFGLLLTACFRR